MKQDHNPTTHGDCSCNTLGVCQGLQDCAGDQACPRYHFAPGAIQSYQRHKRLARRVVLVLEAVAMLAIGLALGVASGYFHAKGWL